MLELQYNLNVLECGTDEAGRGCLSGPVTAAAVILPSTFKCSLLNDSKTLSAKNRNTLRNIIEKESLAFAVAHIYMKDIDSINILNASILAMHKAIEKLKITPKHIAVDGNRFKPFKDIPHKCIIKGDGKYLNIAAASILAKTYRDEYMSKIHSEFPAYNWIQNKGYPTKQHRQAIQDFGPTKYHRKSFKLLPEQLKLKI